MSDNDGMTTTNQTAMIGELRKRMHYPLEVILVCVRWYTAYSLSFGKTPSPRHLEEMMQ
jgi:putative transposase